MTYQVFAANIPKWLFASIAEHFSNAAASPVYKMFIQGQQKTEDDSRQKDFFELRTDGPYIRPKNNRSRLNLEFQVNTLIQSTVDEHSASRPYVDTGKLLTAFVTIPIYRYGDGNNDDQSLIGCAKVAKQGRLEEIRVNQFGVVDTALGLIQATIEAHYILEVDLKQL